MTNDYTIKVKGIIRADSTKVYPSTEALYGPWNSFEQFREYLGEVILKTVTDDDIPNALKIGIKQSDNTVKDYKWTNPDNNVAYWKLCDSVESVNSKTGQVALTKSDIGLGNVDNTADANKNVNSAVKDGNNNNIASTYETKTDAQAKINALTKTSVGLGNVDNTADNAKIVKGANEDGSGNNIATTYETKADATTKQTSLQTAINAIQTTVNNLVGLEGTNYAGFSIDTTEADALAAIPTKYTAAGYIDELVWYLVGDGIDNLKAYHYNGTNTPVLVSSKVYDFTDFSGVVADISTLRQDIDTLDSKIDGHYELVSKEDIDFTEGTIRNNSVSSTDTWAASGSTCIITAAGNYLHATANDISGTRIAFFKSMPPTNNVNANTLKTYLATYDTGTEHVYYYVARGESVNLQIPHNAAYIGFWNTDSSNTNTLVSAAYQYRGKKYISGLVDDVKSLKEKVGTKVLFEVEQGAFRTATGTDFDNMSTLVRTTSFIEASYLYIKIGSNGRYKLFGYDSSGVFVAREDDFRRESAEISIAGCSLYRILFGFADESDITPSDFPSLNVEVYTNRGEDTDSATDVSDFSRSNLVRLTDSIGNSLRPTTYDIDGNGYEIPSTREHLAAMKKAHQLTSIKWTPLLDVPRSTGVFPAGVEVTGLPYSSVKECDKFIGFDVSIHTFMTAVNNPYSLLYTECVSAADSRSAWGITYHGTGNPTRTYFGQVCSVLASNVCGLTGHWPTAYIKWLRNYGSRFSKNYDQSAQGLMIGDMYIMSGHARTICKLKRDSNGNVTHVEVSEATSPTIKHTLYTAAQFDAKVASEDAIIYRNLELYKNEYEPSEYVAVDGETSSTVTYNDDICTFAGDKATFREGDIIVIDYNLKSVGSWTHMELYKDNTLIDTIAIDSSEHYVNLTSRNLTYGQYKARMKDGNNYSEYTFWEILQTNVTVSTTNNNNTISWTSANGKAVSYCVCNIGGVTKCFNELTDEESTAGTVIVDLHKLNHQQQPSSPFENSGMYLKVCFQGKYGRVTNQPIEIEL